MEVIDDGRTRCGANDTRWAGACSSVTAVPSSLRTYACRGKCERKTMKEVKIDRMEIPEQVLQVLDGFQKMRQSEIPRELEDYLCWLFVPALSSSSLIMIQ